MRVRVGVRVRVRVRVTLSWNVEGMGRRRSSQSSGDCSSRIAGETEGCLVDVGASPRACTVTHKSLNPNLNPNANLNQTITLTKILSPTNN
jgi:hypothetical protein